MSAGMPVRFRSVVEAWKTPKDAKATVTFLVNGVKKDVREVQPGEQPVLITFEHRFTQAGEYLVEAVLEGDEYRIDNHRYCLCTVPENVQVLVLDEERSGQWQRRCVEHERRQRLLCAGAGAADTSRRGAGVAFFGEGGSAGADWILKTSKSMPRLCWPGRALSARRRRRSWRAT